MFQFPELLCPGGFQCGEQLPGPLQLELANSSGYFALGATLYTVRCLLKKVPEGSRPSGDGTGCFPCLHTTVLKPTFVQGYPKPGLALAQC